MSASNEIAVKLAAKLPSGDGNGLAGLGYRLTSDPAARRQIRAAIILFDIAEVAEKTDDGSQIAKARIRRIEVIQDGDDFTVMQRILMREFERRTGQTTLPFELEQDIDQLLRLVSNRASESAESVDDWTHRPAWESAAPQPDAEPDVSSDSEESP